MVQKLETTRIAVDRVDLDNPTATAKYPLGFEVALSDTLTGLVKKFKYIQAETALTQYQPYVVDQQANNIKTAAPATNAAKVALIGVPQVAFTDEYYGFVQVEGPAQALIGSTVAVGDHLELTNTGTSLTIDGSTGATVKTENSVGIANEAITTSGTGDVNLFNENVAISA